MNPDCIDEKENVLITPVMIVEAIYSAIESHRPRCWELERQALKLAAVHPEVLEACVAYAREIIKGRWEELEPLLFGAVLNAPQSFEYSVLDPFIREWQLLLGYASEVVKGAWAELESLILTSGCLPDYGVAYAIGCRKSRWREFEKRMLELQYRWPLDEQIYDIIRYATSLLEGDPWPEAESFFMNECQEASPKLAARAAVDYAKKVIRTKWKKGEKLLVGFPAEMSRYAREVLKHKLPDHMHQEMVMKSFETPDDPHIKAYLQMVRSQGAAKQSGQPAGNEPS